ncbi:MAG: hypothetical protein ACTSYL_03615 [Candidatus Thorarchaeota archaeon]
MPKEMHAIWWDDNLGPMIGRSYPEGASLTIEEALRIFMGHGINQEAKIGYTNLSRGLVISLLSTPNCIAVLLDENEDPQLVERNLIRLVDQMDFNSSDWDLEIAQAFQRLNELSENSSRDQLLKREDVRRLVNDMIDGRIGQIEPVHILKAAERYPKVVEYLAGSDEEVARTLNDLVSVGILVPKSHGRKLVCTKCGGTEVYLTLSCPNCHSTDLYKVYMLHCPSCGKITHGVIMDDMEEISCQHCKTAIPVDKIKVLGIELLCNSCSTVTPDPLIVLSCVSCGKRFSALDLLAGTGLAFEINPAGLKKHNDE